MTQYNTLNAKLSNSQYNFFQVEFLGRLLGPLLKTGLSLMKNVLKPSPGSDLIPLGLTAPAAPAAAGVH